MYDYVSVTNGPIFIPGQASDGPVESICRAAWTGLIRGDTKVDSTNRPHFLLALGKAPRRAIELAFEELVSRHTILATRLEERQGSPWLVPDTPPSLEWITISESDVEVEWQAIEEMVGRIVWRHFELHQDRLSRPFVVRFRDGRAWFGLVVHHFVADAISAGLLQNEFMRLYRSSILRQPFPAAAAAVRYQDYLVAIRDWIESPSGRAARSALVDRVKAFPILDFGERNLTISEEWFTFDKKVPMHIGQCARALRTTPYTIILAVHAILIANLTGVERPSLKIITSGRDTSSLVRTVGNLADRQFLLFDLTGDPSFAEIVQRVKSTQAGARSTTFVRSDFVQADLAAGGACVEAPVFNYRRADGGFAESTDKEARKPRVPASDVARTLPRDPYYLDLVERGGSLIGSIRYGAGQIPDFLIRLEALLHAACAAPEKRLSAITRYGSGNHSLT